MSRRAVEASRNLAFALSILAAPLAAQNDLVVEATGVGIGTTTPDSTLHVSKTDGTTMLKVEEASATAANRILLELKNLGLTKLRLHNTNGTGGHSWSYAHLNNGGFGITVDGSGVQEFFLDAAGDLTVTGDVFSTTCSASPCAPDYVFEPDYPLMGLDELSDHVLEHRSLPGVPSAEELVGPINLSQMQMTLLEKVEELTLYTIALHRENREQQRQIEQLSSRLAAVDAD